MSYGLELDGVNKWIFDKIKTNTTIANYVGTNSTFPTVPEIYFNRAKDGATLPYCVFTYLGGQTRNGNSGRKILKKMKYSVQVVSSGQSSKETFIPVAYLEKLFQNDQLSSDIVVAGSHVESDFCFEDKLDGGQQVMRTGIIISITAYPQDPNQLP